MLARPHGMREAVGRRHHQMQHCDRSQDAGGFQAQAGEAAPGWLKGRVEVDKALPVVEIRWGEEEEEEEEEGELHAVVGRVVWDLKSELVIELMGLLRPKWSEGKVTWEAICG